MAARFNFSSRVMSGTERRTANSRYAASYAVNPNRWVKPKPVASGDVKMNPSTAMPNSSRAARLSVARSSEMRFRRTAAKSAFCISQRNKGGTIAPFTTTAFAIAIACSSRSSSKSHDSAVDASSTAAGLIAPARLNELPDGGFTKRRLTREDPFHRPFGGID